ncbi:MAG: 6-phosphogluconate dehydrogenase NAD-binding protein [Candidatus Saccharibacteria bacterium]|nr:6-phosphogluconate dehydrogenase NAD-binding protein [Candidatus Saccharibacteria bacterium]
MAKRLGFIGLGNMGSRLANNLLEDHGEIVVWDRSQERRAERPVGEAEVSDTIEGVIDRADIIFISVFNDAADEDVFEDILRRDITGKYFIDFSTVSPDTTIELAHAVEQKGGQLLDAGISGSILQVETRQLIIFIGGDKSAFNDCRSYIEPLGKQTFYMGASGFGMKGKLCVNLLLGVGLQSLAESLALAQKMGIEKQLMIEVLDSTAVISPSQKSKLELAAKDDYSFINFSLELMYKDFGIIEQQAQKAAAPVPAATAARQVAAIGVAKDIKADFAAVIQIMENLANIKK